MKRLYTGPFSAVYRNVWVARARQMQSDEWLWLLPTRYLLHTVRGQLLDGQPGVFDVPLLTFDDVAARLVRYTDQHIQFLTPYARQKLIEALFEQYAEDEHLAVFRPIIDQPGLYCSVSHAIGEMKRAGLTLDAAEHYLCHRSQDDVTSERQAALAFLFIRYQEALYRDAHVLRVDPEEMLTLACELLEQDGLPPDVPFSSCTTLWVDHFTDFTPLQLRLLQALIRRVPHVGVYIPFDDANRSQLPRLTEQLSETCSVLEQFGLVHVALDRDRPETALKKLQEDWLADREIQMTPVSPIEGLAADSDTDSLVLQPSTDRLLGRQANGEDSSGDRRLPAPPGLVCLPACTARREVETIAKEIKRLVRLNGVALNEIAIVVKDVSYETLIHEIFQRDGIPLYPNERIGLHESAVVRQLLALLSLAGSDWNRRDLLCLAQGGYIDWEHPPPPGFETWVRQIGIDKGKKSFREACLRELAQLALSERQLVESDSDISVRERKKDALNRKQQKLQHTLDWLQEVEQLEKTLLTVDTWRDRINQVERIWQTLNVEGCIKRLWADALKRGDVKGYSRDLTAFRLLFDTLQEMKQLQPILPHQTERSWQGFISELRELTTQKRVTVTRGHNGGVRVFEPSAIRGASFQVVFVLGLNEGSFPAHHREDWLIRDAERVALYGGQARLPASYAHNEMEQLFFAMATSSARNQLILSYISPEANEEVLRSRFLEQLQQRYLPGDWLAPARFQEAMESRLFARDAHDITSLPEHHNRLLARWGNSDPSGIIDSTSPSAYSPEKKRFAQLIRHAEIEKARREDDYGPWDGHLLDPRIHDRLQQEFSQERTYSVSWLNDYATCPLQFFFARVLRVQPLEEMELTLSPLDTGTVLHEVLRRLLTLFPDCHMCDRDLQQWQIDLETVFDEVASEWESERPHLLSPLWPLEKARLRHVLQNWLQHEYTRQGRRRFKASRLEFSFGLPLGERVDRDSIEQPIAIALANETLQLVGRIDRIDHDDEGNFVLYDYKLSTSRYSGCHDMEQTTNFQLPLYVLAYQQWLAEQGRPGKAVGAGFYGLRSQDGYKKVGLWEKSALDDLGLGKLRSGVTEDVAEEAKVVLPRIAEMLASVRSGRFYMLPEHEPNPYYGDEAVFRHDPVTLQQKARAVAERGNDDA